MHMAHQQHPDQRYLQGIVNGDSTIIEEIYSKYSNSILKLVQKHHGTAEDARDVFQDSIIVILKKARQSDFQLTSSFLTYFYAVCRNVWWKILKKNHSNTVTIEPELGLMDNGDIEEAVLRRERHQFYLSKLATLSGSCRQILELHMEGKRVKEIVKIMGLSSESYARKRKFNCKEQLLKSIKEDAIYQELIN